MRLAWLVMVAVATAGCSPEPARTDNLVEEIIASTPGLTDECIEHLRRDGLGGESLPTGRCFRMDRPQRWRGLWRAEFEGSQFCPEPAATCGLRPGRAGMWLSGFEDVSRDMPGKLYRVEFIGRRTLFPGPHGHGGTFDHEVIVEQPISIEEVAEE